MNDVIEEINRYSGRNDTKMKKLPLLFKEYTDPKVNESDQKSKQTSVQKSMKQVVPRVVKKLKIDAYQYITDNMYKLEEWSGKRYRSVLFDSDRDGQDSSVFRNRIMNH